MSWLSNLAFGLAGHQLASQDGQELELLRDEQHIVSAGEFVAQEFYIQNDHCELEITSQVDKGQDMYMAVMEKGEFEWQVEKESNEFDPETVHEMVVSEEQESVSIDLEEGDYILYFSPVSNSGDPSRLNGDATVTDKSALVVIVKATHVMSLFFIILFIGMAVDSWLVILALLGITHAGFTLFYRRL